MTNNNKWQTNMNDKQQARTNDKQRQTTNNDKRQTTTNDKPQTTTSDKQQATTNKDKRQTLTSLNNWTTLTILTDQWLIKRIVYLVLLISRCSMRISYTRRCASLVHLYCEWTTPDNINSLFRKNAPALALHSAALGIIFIITGFKSSSSSFVFSSITEKVFYLRWCNVLLKLSVMRSGAVVFNYQNDVPPGDTQNAKRVEPCRRVHLYEYDKTFYNTLWFCILKSLKSLHNVLKSSQITPEVPKSMHLGHIFLLGLAKQFFFTVPLSSPTKGTPALPILQMAFRLLLFVSKVKKKHITGHN